MVTSPPTPALTRRLGEFDWRWLILLLAAAAYTIILTNLSWQRVERFETGVTDLGHFDNYMWRIGHGLSNYSPTVMYTGQTGHTYAIMYLLAPLYRLCNGLKAILVIQSLAVAIGSAPLYLLGTRVLKSPGPALVFALLYLIYGPLHLTNLDDFHPEVLAIPLILFTAYFIETERYATGLLLATLSLVCKETYALALLGFSGILALKRVWRVAAMFAVIGVAWMFVRQATGGYGRGDVPMWGSTYFGHMGSSEGEVARYLLRHPTYIVSRCLEAESLTYFALLLLPVLGLGLLAPRWLIPALPTLTLNVVSQWAPTRMIGYHYTAPIIPFVWIASMHGAGWLTARLEQLGEALRHRTAKCDFRFLAQKFVPAFLVVFTIITRVMGRPETVDDPARVRANRAHRVAMQRALAIVPPRASVSAQYYFVPHLAHRERIYWFPMPFWQYERQRQPRYQYQLELFDPAVFDTRLRNERIDFVLTDDKGFTLRNPPIYVPIETPEELRRAIACVRSSGLYDLIFEQDGVTLFRRKTEA